MALYFKIDQVDTGPGFITHDDWEKSGLTFSVRGAVVAVGGDAKAAAGWAKRVGAVAVDEKTAVLTIDKAEKAGAEAEIAVKQAEVVELTNRVSVLDAKISAAEAVR